MFLCVGTRICGLQCVPNELFIKVQVCVHSCVHLVRVVCVLVCLQCVPTWGGHFGGVWGIGVVLRGILGSIESMVW